MSDATNVIIDAKVEDAGAPLGWGLHGDRIDVPETATGWRVKRLSGTGRAGAPEVVYANGVPLFLPLSAGVQDLSEAVDGIAGKYRLDVVDECCKPIANAAAAYVMLGGQSASRDGDSLARVLDSVERLARINADAMEKLSTQLSAVVDASSRLVNAADSAGVTRRELAQLPIQVGVEQAAAPPEQESKTAAALVPVIESLSPYIPNLVNGLAAWLMSKAMPGAAPPVVPSDGGGL